MEKKLTVEVLFPEIANLYGDSENITYLKKSCNEIEVIETSLIGEPHFVREIPSLIYMGTMTEKGQELAVSKLSEHKDRVVELIENGVHFLLTGNALEVFGKEIKDVDGTVCQGLGIFPIYTRRDMMNRFNSLYLGKMGEMDIVGFKSQFTHSYWDENASEFSDSYLFDTVRGPGLNPDIKEEGIRKNNFMATYVIGPLLVLNPPFTKWLLTEIGAGENPALAYEKAAMEAYEARVSEYSDENTGFYY